MVKFGISVITFQTELLCYIDQFYFLTPHNQTLKK